MSFGSDSGDGAGLAEPLCGLETAVAAVVDQVPSAMVDAELHADLLRLARCRSRQDATFATWVLAAVRRGLGVEDGYVDTIGWLSWKTGKPRAEVRRVARLAELCELLPETGTAWREGEITTTAVELIAGARVDGCDDQLRAVEPELLERARRGDHKTLRILTTHFAQCARADGTRPDTPDGLKLVSVGDRHELRGDFGPAAAETVAEAVNAFTRPPTSDDGTTLAQRQAEGFVRMCEVALARGTNAEGSRPVVSYITQARTADDAMPPVTRSAFVGVIGPNERDRILCDATISRVETDADGVPLSVGRATSVWPVAIRRAIVSRDGHCRWPGCEMPHPWCDAHHVRHREHGGATTSDNGTLLCRGHHSFLHAHPQWTATFHEQRFRVFRPDGSEVYPDPWYGRDAA